MVPRINDAIAVELRPIESGDRDECARILYEAFGAFDDRHGFPRNCRTLETAVQLTTNFIAHPLIWGVVATHAGQILGSNFLDERGAIKGVGPITVDPEAQAQGVGRRLMEAVLERGQGAVGIRLFQDAFNVQSLSLYASLGFEVKEPAAVISGRLRSGPDRCIQVRPLEEGDLEECETLCLRVHGFERTNELRDALQGPAFSPFVAVRGGRIRAYVTTLTFFSGAHGVAETESDMRALITGVLATGDAPASFILPTRQAGLFRWCLSEGLRVVKPMTYMAIGEYRKPQGCWIPSVLY